MPQASVAFHRIGLTAGLFCALLGTGCRSQAEREADIANGDDPMAALAVSATSTRYTTRYWVTQAEQKTPIWERGRTYCEQQRSAAQGAKPNCGALFDAQLEIAGREVRPPRPGTGQRVDTLVFRP